MRPIRQMAWFKEAIDFCCLREVGFVGPKYTWLYQKHDGSQIRERLDRALATQDWLTLFPSAKLFHKSSFVSDHSPLFLSFLHKPKKKKQKKPFKFESMLLKDAQCDQVVSDAWNERLISSVDFPIVRCLEECKAKLEDWNLNVFEHVGKKIAQLQKELEW